MKIHARLKRLEAAALQLAAAPPPPASRRWLRILQWMATWQEAPGREVRDEAIAAWAAAAQLREAVAVLRDYVESGRVGAHVEDHCAGALRRVSAWASAQPDDPCYETPCPVVDEAQKLRQCLTIDGWRAAGANTGP